MTKTIATVLAIAAALAACASPERIREARGDQISRAYRLQPAAMTAASDAVYEELYGFEEKGASPAPVDPSVTISYFDMNSDDFDDGRRRLWPAHALKDTDTMAGYSLPRYLGVRTICVVFQVRVGDLVRRVDGTPMFVVTPRIHAAIRHHETRHCYGEEHDENNVWKES